MLVTLTTCSHQREHQIAKTISSLSHVTKYLQSEKAAFNLNLKPVQSFGDTDDIFLSIYRTLQ